MSATDLSSYDGKAGVLVDTNIWLDCMDPRSPWQEWALSELQSCGERCPLHINVVIYTELLIPGPDLAALDEMPDIYQARRSALPWAAAPLAAAAYALYRHRGGSRSKPLPDFFIGAHAAAANLAVLTRDPNPYRSYFARLQVIAP